MINEYVITRMRVIQKELEELQKVAERQLHTPKKKARLKGLWKGIQVTDNDFQEAKRALFKDAYKLDK